MIKKDYSNLKAFVINLDDYQENYEKQLPYLQSIGLKVERFSGINALKDEHLKPEYKQYISKFALNFTPKSIIGCALSHILCCKYIYDNYISIKDNNNNIACGAISPQYFLILEDDCYPLFNSGEFYRRLYNDFNNIEILDNDWEIIQLHSDGLISTKNTYTTHYICGSTAAYLISKNGIKKMIKQRVSNHLDFITQNFVNFKKYRVKENLFWTDEKDSLNRKSFSKIQYYSLNIKSKILEKINKYIKLLDRGEKSYINYLQFKVIKLPYFNKDYTLNELLDSFIFSFLIKNINKKFK